MDHQVRNITGHRSIDVPPDWVYLKVHLISHKEGDSNPTLFLNGLG